MLRHTCSLSEQEPLTADVHDTQDVAAAPLDLALQRDRLWRGEQIARWERRYAFCTKITFCVYCIALPSIFFFDVRWVRYVGGACMLLTMIFFQILPYCERRIEELQDKN